MSKKRKTHEEFETELNIINPYIKLNSEYVGARDYIECECLIDGNIWKATPTNLLKGRGCPECKRRKHTKTHEEFIKEFYEKNPNAENIEILDEYKRIDRKIKCKCKVCGHEWNPKPNLLLEGKGCRICGIESQKQKLSKNHEDFIKEMNDINPNIDILGIYERNNIGIKCKCKLCNHIWYPIPHTLLTNKTGCPKCKSSKGEDKIAIYLQENNIPYIMNKRYFKDLNGIGGMGLKPDFIIEERKIWIEYDGIGHFEPTDFAGKGEEWAKENFKTLQLHDKLKDEYAKEHNWNLIRIPYWNYDKIEKILDNIL